MAQNDSTSLALQLLNPGTIDIYFVLPWFFSRQRAVKEESLEFISRFSIEPRDLWCHGSEWLWQHFWPRASSWGKSVFYLQGFWWYLQTSVCVYKLCTMHLLYIQVYLFTIFSHRYLDYIHLPHVDCAYMYAPVRLKKLNRFLWKAFSRVLEDNQKGKLGGFQKTTWFSQWESMKLNRLRDWVYGYNFFLDDLIGWVLELEVPKKYHKGFFVARN